MITDIEDSKRQCQTKYFNSSVATLLALQILPNTERYWGLLSEPCNVVTPSESIWRIYDIPESKIGLSHIVLMI